jgi:protein-S-isoprenylcysteine O-methyltransferase Ste14
MNFLNNKLPPPVAAILIAAIMWKLVNLTASVHLFPQWVKFLSIPILAVGLIFDVLGLIEFIRLKTTINPLTPHKTSALATQGVYRITRNPMYVGLAFTLTAWALYLCSALAFVGPIIFIAYITRFQIKPEEKNLLLLFGEPYKIYMKNVRRWL